MGKVFYLEDVDKFSGLADESDICLDTLVKDWVEAIEFKVHEINEKHGRSAAYHFYSRITFQDMDKSRIIVDAYLKNSSVRTLDF